MAVAAGVAIGAATLAAQSSGSRASSATKAWIADRTPDGHPDFQGVWANNTVTPLQRPKQWEGKTRLSDAEIAELQKIAQQIYDNDGDAQFGDGLILAVLDKITNPGSYDAGTGNYNQFWLVGRDWHDRRTALITNPADGKIPAMTAEAQKRRAAEMESRRLHAFEDPESFALGERCVNFGWPKAGAGYNSYLQIVQSPGYVTMMAEMAHDARIIPTDGRPHADKSIRTWNGDARGHWEGDTLVVDTIHLKEATITNNGLSHSDKVHVIERFRLSADGKMLLATQEFEDPEKLLNKGVRFITWNRVEGDHVHAYDCDPSFAENYAK
jgi:hypothetical protein